MSVVHNSEQMFEICRNPLAFPLRIVYNQRSETQKAGLLPADVESEGADMAEDKKKASDKAKDSQTDNKHKALEAALAQIEKNYGKGDFRIYKYTKKDYVRSEKIKTSIALLISFLIMTGLLCIMQLDIVIMKLREGKVIVSAAVIIGIYVAVFFVYLHFTKMRASRQYDEVRARVLIYDKHLEELETLYKEKENEDISPTIVEEEDEDGKIIDI